MTKSEHFVREFLKFYFGMPAMNTVKQDRKLDDLAEMAMSIVNGNPSKPDIKYKRNKRL